MTQRASIYGRISRDRVGAGLKVATQVSDCRDLAESLGLEVVSVHSDNDISAYSGKPRPGYRALLEEIDRGQVNVVLAWHTDRLHRSPAELEEYVTACEAKDSVATHTVKTGHIDLSTASGRMVARLLGATARYEVEHSIERTVRAKRRAAESGVWKGGRRPFGYEADGVTVRTREADAIADATTRLLAGASINSLIKEWNEAGSLTTMGNAWARNSFRTTVLKVRNAGLMEHKGQILGPAQWPAIVPEVQWRALVAMLNNPSRRSNVANTARRWLGSGLYKCECGSKLICAQTNKSASYRCRDGCGRLSRRQSDVDSMISQYVVSRLRRADVSDLLDDRDNGALEGLEAESLTLRARLDALAGFFAQGLIDAQQLTEGTREINLRLSTVRSEIVQTYQGTALSGVADAPDPGQAWLDASLDRKRAVLDKLVSVTLLRGAAGRPAEWRPGQSYFRPDLVRIEPKN